MKFAKILLALLLIPQLCLADPLGDIDDVFNNLSTYYSKPTFYSGPTRSGVSFGSFRVFMPNKRIVPLTINPPSISATCGGISVYGGGFSFINADKFVEMLQNIMNAAAGYFFEMAIEQLCPTCHNIMSLLRHASQLAQKFAFDSCSAGKKLGEKSFTWLVRHTDISQHAVDTGSDWIRSADDYIEKMLNGDTSRIQDRLTTDMNSCDPKTGKNCLTGNYIYEVVKKSGGSDQDAEIIMSLAGTYIWKPNPDKTNVNTIYKKPILTALLLAKGCSSDTDELSGACKDYSCSNGTIPVYHCLDTSPRCLDVTVVCRQKQNIVEKTKESLREVVDKLNKREDVADNNMLGVFYYTPLLKEAWNAVKLYPKTLRDSFLEELIDTSSSAFVYLYLDGYLRSVMHELFAKRKVLIGPRDEMEENTKVLYKNLEQAFVDIEKLKDQSFEIVRKKIATLNDLLQIARIVNQKNEEAKKSASRKTK